jgi:hypothetical protein
LRAASASVVGRVKTEGREEVVNWAFRKPVGRRERATEALDAETARRTERAAAVRYNMVRTTSVQARMPRALPIAPRTQRSS